MHLSIDIYVYMHLLYIYIYIYVLYTHVLYIYVYIVKYCIPVPWLPGQKQISRLRGDQLVPLLLAGNYGCSSTNCISY